MQNDPVLNNLVILGQAEWPREGIHVQKQD